MEEVSKENETSEEGKTEEYVFKFVAGTVGVGMSGPGS